MSATAGTTLGTTQPASRRVDEVFKERGAGGRFTKTNQRKLNRLIRNQILPNRGSGDFRAESTPLRLALDAQRVFRAAAVFAHGFLAGLAFWQLLMVFVLWDGAGATGLDFVALYSPMAQPLSCLFYLLTATCLVSVLDRYDLAQFSWRHLRMLVTFRSGGLSIVIYLAALVVTLAMANLDDRLSLHRVNATHFETAKTAVR